MTEISLAVVVFGLLGAISVLGYLSASRSADRIDRMNRTSAHVSGTHVSGTHVSGLRPPADGL
ncbi:MAG: hypothetical protein U1E06_02350 [Tabrizicola sp.]|uniref:hypothetical protein n=1 Tax=Tabrizicola sp. TaxID=2005166 RepID=UPI002733283F|nr:hypothetical protein [Tabrizicola sp.]MDP3262889.1 hypothetical protein [Tabrizicola sp.]MDP3649086.1 hypothetical protein [Paracoccaceae bacterium]MDZ4065687.1 hypothetical protein [Tabrizicola sp.]